MTIGKSREELYELFKTGAKPSGADFQDLIDSAVNSSDDGIEKPLGDDTPLKINARGDTENLLDFYAGDLHTWRINQKPTQETPGLNFATATGDSSRLFIDSSTGKVGLSTTTPTAKLHIQQNGSEDALRIEDEETDTTPLVVDAEGNVGIGKPDPGEKLDVQGNAAIAGSLSIVHTNQTGSGNTVVIGPINQTNLRLGYHENYAWVQSHHSKPLAINPLGNNVGIGTDDPKVTLDVKGEMAIAGNLEISETLKTQVLRVDSHSRASHINGDGILYRKEGQFYLTVDDHFYIRDSASSTTSDNIKFHFNTDNNGGLEVKGTGTSSFAGSVGIGTNTPRAKLEVNGDIWAYEHGIYFLDKYNAQSDGMGVRYGGNATLEIFSDHQIAFVESDNNTTAASIDVNNGTIKATSFQIGGEKIVESDIAILKKLAKGNLIIRLQEQNGDKFLDSGQITVHNGNQGDWQKWKVLIT